MKKWMISATVAILAFAACQNKLEESVPAQPEEEVPAFYTYTLKAALDEEVTKSSYDAVGNFTWTAGDQVSLLCHKGSEHKFFTLTTSSGGSNTATFSGAIETGYEVGSEGGEKWALYPANEGHEWDAARSLPNFNIDAVQDFSGKAFSANVPMHAIGDASDNFTFKNLTGCYRFTFKDLEVSKVKLEVEHVANGYYLSGKSPIKQSGSDIYLNCYSGSGSTSASYIQDVPASKTVSFYVPFRAWEGLQPKLTLVNMEEGASKDFILLSAEAKAKLASASMSKFYDVPAVSVPGKGVPFVSAFGINWSAIAAEYPGDGERIINWKAASDASNIYFFFKTSAQVAKDRGVWNAYIVTGYDTDNDDTTGEAGSYGLGDGFEARSIAYPFSNAKDSEVSFYGPGSPNTSSNIKCPVSGSSLGMVPTNGSRAGDYAYAEIKIPRSAIGSPASGATIRVRQAYGSTSSAAQTITLK